MFFKILFEFILIKISCLFREFGRKHIFRIFVVKKNVFIYTFYVKIYIWRKIYVKSICIFCIILVSSILLGIWYMIMYKSLIFWKFPLLYFGFSNWLKCPVKSQSLIFAKVMRCTVGLEKISTLLYFRLENFERF